MECLKLFHAWCMQSTVMHILALLQVFVVVNLLTLQLPIWGTQEAHSQPVSTVKEVMRGATSCPPWFTPVCNHQSCNCTCGDSLYDGMVTCTSSSVTILTCYCMTVDLHTNATVVGSCPYACIRQTKWYSNPLELNHDTCDQIWKRTGQLCAQCEDGHGPVVYSYSIHCTPCSSERTKDTLMFLFASFIPLTVF